MLPTWTDFARIRTTTRSGSGRRCARTSRRVTVPTLNVAGWWDQEDFYGPVTIYRELEKHDSANRNFLVVGPWRHGGWSGGPGQKLGKIDFGSPTGEYYRQKIEAPFFAYYLKDEGTLKQPEATVFEAGSNQWRTFSSWPPREATTRSLYFHDGGQAVVHATDTAGASAGRQLRERSGAPGSLSAAPDRADVLSQGLGLVHLAAGRPAIRAGAPRRAELGDRAAVRGRRGRGRDHRASCSRAPPGRMPTGS